MTLERRTPLARGAGPKADPAKVREWTDRSRKRLPARSAKTAASIPEWTAAKAAVDARSGGLCEAETPACPSGPHRGVHHHHVLRRSQTAEHDPALIILVCVPAHRHIHANPAESYDRGWLRRSTDL